jgi:hydrogenase expression/formation protein HypD
MEVCGTHTMAIFRSGIRALLPNTLSLISGPGCPVCVTAQNEIDAFIELSRIDDVIITTFGDLLRVPGTGSSLQKERAAGRDIRMVYSPIDALDAAKKNPDKKIVFLGVGFETTAPIIAAAILETRERGIDNFFVYSAHKLVPPALNTLMGIDGVNVAGFLLPGHVSVIIGLEAYRPFFERYRIPCVVSGFEAVDILHSIQLLIEQIEASEPRLENGYPRAVTSEGNKKAQQMIQKVFEPVDAPWRGIGSIPESGLKIREEFSAFDAKIAFEVEVPETPEPAGCACGQILAGLKTPPECSLYKKVCTPTDPVGPCMVSSEGTCAAYYRYHSP